MSYLNDKWILSSCLQKSVRRSLVDLSILYFRKLKEIDPNYSIIRLLSIAIEDVAIANPNQLISLMEILNEDKYSFKSLHQQKYEDILIELTSGPKDRTPQELASLANYTSLDLCNISNDLIINYYEDLVQLKNSNKDSMNFIAKYITDYDITNMLSLISETSFYKTYLYIAYAQILRQQSEKEQFNLGKYITNDVIEINVKNELFDNILISGMDWHTHIGKTLINKFIDVKCDFNLYVRDKIPYKEMVAKIAGTILFIQDGQFCSRRLFYEASYNMYHSMSKIHLNEYLEYGIDINYLCELFQRDKTILYEIIKKQIG